MDLTVIREALGNYPHVGIRGLSGIDANKKYRYNQILSKSLDLFDDRGTDYRRAASLSGTCAVGIYDCYTDDEIFAAISRAANYAQDGKICLIVGDYRTYGTDYNEVIISVTDGWDRRGARFICYL